MSSSGVAIAVAPPPSPLLSVNNLTDCPLCSSVVLVQQTLGLDLLCIVIPVLVGVMLFLWIIHRCSRYRLKVSLRRGLASAPGRAEVAAVAAGLRLPHPSAAVARGGSSPRHSLALPSPCVVCLRSPVLAPVELLPCGHTEFCAPCVVEMWRYGVGGTHRPLRCPLCRGVVECVVPHDVWRRQMLAECSGGRGRVMQPPSPTTRSMTATATRHAAANDEMETLGVSLDDLDDDVVLQLVYNTAFFPKGRQPWWRHAILGLRCVTHAQWLPVVVGLRIAFLHVTMIAYLLLPGDLTFTQRPDMEAHTPHNALVRAIALCLHLTLCYADDIFLLCAGVIAVGHALQRLLFSDVNPA